MPIRRRRTRRMRGGSVPDPVGTTAKNSAYQILRRPTRSNIFGRLADIHQGLRNNRTISNYLTTKGWGRLGNFASMLGYGKRRRTVRRRRLTGGRKRRTTLRKRSSLHRLVGGRTTRRRMTGRGFFGDIWGGIKNVGRALAPTVANLAVKRFTGGAKRRRRPTYTTKKRLNDVRRRMNNLLRRLIKRPKKVGRPKKKMTGRGIFGKIAGGLLGSILPF